MNKVNYEILNTLNLISCELGDAYLQNGYNPFDENFVLNQNFAEKLIQNKKVKENIMCPDFLKKSNKEIIRYFENSLKNSQLLQENLKSKNTDKYISVLLTNRIEMLKIAIKKLMSKDANSFALYKDIYGISPKLSEIMANSFFENFHLETAILQFNNLVNDLSNISATPKNNKEKVIKNNQEKTQSK